MAAGGIGVGELCDPATMMGKLLKFIKYIQDEQT